MATPTLIDLGAFAAGAVPPDLEVAFTDFDGVAVDLTGFVDPPQCNISEELAGPTGLGTGTPSYSDQAGGKALYAWDRADMAAVGEYQLQLWVNNGNKYYESDLYTYSVYDGPGDPP